MILTIAITMFCFYNSLWNVAKTYDAAAIDGSTYDGCGIATTGQIDVIADQGSFESGWTQVFAFNAIVYAISIAFAGIALVTLWIPMCSACIICGNACLFFPLLAALIMTGIRRLNTTGSLCAYSASISDPATAETFADNGATMKALFIAQCVLQIPMFCCNWFAMLFSL